MRLRLRAPYVTCAIFALALVYGVATKARPDTLASGSNPSSRTATSQPPSIDRTPEMIEVVVEGGDRNGPVAARPSLVVKGYKANWANTNAPLPKTQEIDPLIVLGRQGGGRDPAGRTTDMSGILVNVANTGSGFLSMTEMQSRIIDAKSAEPIKAIDIQEGVLDKVRKSYIGEVINAFNGRLGNAIQVQATGPGAEWQNVLVNIRPSDGVANLKIDANGNIHTLGYVQASLATPASSTSPCAPGQQEADNQYIYVCTSSNTWKRAALTNF